MLPVVMIGSHYHLSRIFNLVQLLGGMMLLLRYHSFPPTMIHPELINCVKSMHPNNGVS